MSCAPTFVLPIPLDGGDEFVLLLDCDLLAAQGQIERIERWVFGEYTLPSDAGHAPLKLDIRASIGAAEWSSGNPWHT